MFRHWNITLWEYEFLSPHWLWLLCGIPFLLWAIFRAERRRNGEMRFSRSAYEQRSLGNHATKYLRMVLLLAYGTVTALLIVALARPFHWSAYEDHQEDYKNGIDIVIALDISASMLARDFTPNRLEAAKQVAKEFIDGRRGDRIGLVVYEGEAYTACPATLDYNILKNQIDQLQSGMLEPGTAIGTGLGTAVTRLRNDSLPSKVIILLTDGVSLQGSTTPEEAARLARAKNVKVYTIGVGSRGMAPSPDFTPFGVRYINMEVEIDEATLMNIARITGGKYFRATDEQSLRSIYNEIDRLEKRRIRHIDYKSEPPVSPMPFLNWALLLGLAAWSVQLFYFRSNG